MSLRQTVAEDIKEARKNSGSQRGELDQIEVDMGEMTFTHFHPTTIVTGEFPADEGNPIIRFSDEQHNNGRIDQGYLGLIIDNPGVLASEEEQTEDTVIIDVADSNEVRVFNTADRDTDLIDGVGVEYNDRLYKGEVVDSFPDDRIILIVSGAASKSVAKKLDVCGAKTAGMNEETGRKNDGLIEYTDDPDAEVRSRYARSPELREDLYGADVGVMVSRREELDDKYAELVESGDRRGMKWFALFADFGDGLEPVEATDEGTAVRSSYILWNFDPSVGSGRIPDEDYDFVQQYVDAGLPSDRDTIEQNIENNSSDLSNRPDVDRMVELIQQQLA